MVESDIEIALSLCEVCPSGDTSGVAEVLLQCFESNRKVIDLLKSVIDREVSSTGKKKKKIKKRNQRQMYLI